MKKNLIIGLAAMALAMSSCSEDKNMYDPDFAQKEYSQNFKKRYAASVDIPNQTWDYTPGANYTLASSPLKAKTRAEGASITPGEYYQVESSTLDWLTNTLKEGNDNRSLGAPFVMSMPSNSFTIVPIYQGQAALAWDLHMVVDGVDYKIWSKSQGIQIKSTTYGSWSNLSTSGNTLSAKAVRSLQYTVDNVPVGSNIYFYLYVTTGAKDYANKDTKQSSLAGMMLTLDCPRPTNISEKKEVRIIGCEDANLKNSDWDLNDVVFMVIGNPEAPKPIRIENETIVQSYDKRYMIEDLGATDDFDFNDIVVDVHAERTVKYELTNGIPTDTIYGEWSQKANVRHLGGTLPFTLKIGNKIIDDITPELDKDIDREYTITGWDPTLNNIEVTVQNASNEGVQKIGFPKKGEVPMIVAFDTKQSWMPERESIPASWFTVE